MAEFTPFWQQPSHPERIKLVKGQQAYHSAVYSLVSLPAGALFAKITTATPVSHTTYTSVATGNDTRIELNSDLVYCNHSCAPSLIFDMTRFEVRVAPDRPLKAGDMLTFFYPSTEWQMVQPFDCECGAGEKCLGFISGSANVDSSVLSRYWLNQHIRQLMADKMGLEAYSKMPNGYADDEAAKDAVPGAGAQPQIIT
ncbi:hypothetical protein CDD81_6490 [Ophiocordyceps australis]|uniref:Post-SET domain-containing protein n=1 Tax=Ophiocordyceps australis TaxID=1399860 RepID=A0A2C5YGA9_9HYPO|nr:hypothetical protein CDD81_6490 [Ophiocordyceps australis]